MRLTREQAWPDDHGRRPSGPRRLRSLFVLLAISVLATVGWLVFPIAASAESLCTDTWTGPAEGSWLTGSNWSGGHVPDSTDVACIGAEKVAVVGSGVNQVGVVQGAGGRAITRGALDIENALEASLVGSVKMTHRHPRGAPAP